MKRYLLTTLIVLALGAGIGIAQKKAEAVSIEKARVEFTEPLKLLNVILRGQYLFVHDEDKMAKGEDCTYVYDSAGKLVVSFHCEPVQRDKATQFKVLVTTRGGLAEIDEYQFAGSVEGHRVPRGE